MVIRVEQGKRRKDRYVMLSAMLLDILRTYAPLIEVLSLADILGG